MDFLSLVEYEVAMILAPAVQAAHRFGERRNA
jgi:hypothetical protein